MSLGEIEELIKDSEPAVRGKKQTLLSALNDHAHDSNPSVAVHCRTDRGDGEGNCGGGAVDSGSALRLFLDHVPISSIPGIRNTPVLELKTGDTLRDAIDLLYEKNVSGAPIADAVDPEATVGSHRFTDQYIGFIDFARLVLWSLEKYEKDHTSGTEGEGGDNEASVDGIFTMLEQNPQIGQAKVGELAKSFLLDPFFPVNLDDTLFHVLLLLSKHRLQVVPVMEQPNSRVIGFITQLAVVQSLLQSSGLEWFDNIANKTLAELRFENEENVAEVCEDQSIEEAMHILWKSQIGAIAVLHRRTRKLVGSLRSIDVHLLLDKDDLFHYRKDFTVGEFIHLDDSKKGFDPTVERDIGALISEGILRLRNSFTPRMDSPVTNKDTDTLKQAMGSMVERKSNFSFLVNELHQVKGVVISRDIISHFGPPGMDSSIQGVGFFESALQQSGWHVEGKDHCF